MLRLLIGRPLLNQEISNEKLPKWKALAIFSSDALSSVAYGPEQILLVLALPGVLAYGYLSYVAAAILLLLALVTLSYVQIGKANPGGGGSYAVARQNLGEMPALIAAASLLADYTLTVAVSISAGTAALVAAFPVFADWQVAIDLAVLFGILMLINLRGIREASTAFVYPTYAFIIGILALVAVGSWQAFTQTAPVIPAASLERQFDWTMLLLLLRAFANGCSSMTGVEAISNGIPMFRSPAVRNASITSFWMSGLLGIMFLGITAFLLINTIERTFNHLWQVKPRPWLARLRLRARPASRPQPRPCRAAVRRFPHPRPWLRRGSPGVRWRRPHRRTSAALRAPAAQVCCCTAFVAAGRRKAAVGLTGRCGSCRASRKNGNC